MRLLLPHGTVTLSHSWGTKQSHVYVQTCPDLCHPAQDPTAPSFSRAKPRNLQQQQATVHLVKRNLSCQGLRVCWGGLISLCAQTPRRACPRIDWPGRAQNLWPPLVKSSNVNRGMSRLAQSHQAPTGAINLYNMWKEECTSQQASGAGGGVSGKGGSCFFFFFFGRTTGCRKQKINLSAWLSPAISLVLHKQRNALWFCSITTIAGPFWGARSLLEATLMQDG